MSSSQEGDPSRTPSLNGNQWNHELDRIITFQVITSEAVIAVDGVCVGSVWQRDVNARKCREMQKILRKRNALSDDEAEYSSTESLLPTSEADDKNLKRRRQVESGPALPHSCHANCLTRKDASSADHQLFHVYVPIALTLLALWTRLYKISWADYVV
ncbi:hypothetical protein BC830DRAFT_1087126, partial [Chytriomyces sp. MP71]